MTDTTNNTHTQSNQPQPSNPDPFPMVHPLTFIQNPLMQHLADDPHWTVSDDSKRPVNARVLLDTGDVRNARFDGESPLVTLNELDANPNLQAVNRAYRLRARENRVIAIDVEPEAPDAMKQDALNMGAHYTELSKNGGVHLLIRVPDDLITDDNRYMFDDLSVIKETVPKVENGPDKGKEARSAYYEVLFNDHFVTFTKRMLTQKPCVDYATDPVAKQQLADFLHNIVQMDAKKKQERELAKQYRIGMVEDMLDDEKEEMLDEFLSLRPFENALQQAGEKDVSDFGGDYSRYEMSVANGLAYHTLRVQKLAKDTMSFKKIAETLTEQDMAYAVYLMLKDIVPYRDKHDEDRDGLPWLLFTAKRAYEYVASQNAKREQDKR